MIEKFLSFVTAAKEVSKNPAKEKEIARKYGVPLENMTSDEITEFRRLTRQYRSQSLGRTL